MILGRLQRFVSSWTTLVARSGTKAGGALATLLWIGE
jgi:hypothetical protein